MAITPNISAQTILENNAGESSLESSLFDAVIIALTNAPESDDVTKKVTILIKETTIRMLAPGYCSKNAKSDAEIS